MSGDRPPQHELSASVTSMRFQQARALFREKKWMEALVEAEELLDEVPDEPDTLFLVAEACLELGDAVGADAAYVRFLELHPQQVNALVGMAVARFELTDMDGCLTCTRQCLALAEDMAEAWFYQGMALSWLGREEDAEASLERAHGLHAAHYPKVEPLDDKTWEAHIAGALVRLSPEMQAFYKDVPVERRVRPDLGLLRAVNPPMSPSCGALFVGTPPAPPVDPWTHKPESLQIFSESLERSAAIHGALEQALAEAFRGEALVWLGLPRDSHPLKS